METTLPLGSRREVGFSAIIKQARAGGKYRVKRNARPLQGNGSEKGDIEIGAPSGAEMGDIQGFDRIGVPNGRRPSAGGFSCRSICFVSTG